jgi:hypothetical protein
MEMKRITFAKLHLLPALLNTPAKPPRHLSKRELIRCIRSDRRALMQRSAFSAPLAPFVIGPDVLRRLRRFRGKAVVLAIDSILRDALARHAGDVDAEMLDPYAASVRRTLARKIKRRLVEPNANALISWVERICSVNGRKYSALSRRRLNPRLRLGNDESKSAEHSVMLVAYGVPMPADTACEIPTGEQVMIANELQDRVRQMEDALDAVDIAVFKAVQDLRLQTGKNFLPPVAARVICDHKGKIVGLADVTITAMPSQKLVSRVRRVYQKVRSHFHDALTKAGYDCPEV